ncbi:MAG: glutamine--fructose-6-phosphate transaminase (isomerizing) [Candidatus Thorarchaeota archaeon]
MCGIIGVVQKKGNVAPFIHEALKRLEYRGYDSVGITTLHDGGFSTKKDRGRIEEVHRRLDLDDLPGTVGIGHTRWATHGIPSMYNSHPHFDCSGKVAVVHNGVIDNFLVLRDELNKRGHRFESETDTEVIPHLLEEYISVGDNLKTALTKVVKQIKGTYAIVAMSVSEPDKLVCTRDGNPLVIGRGDGATYVSSDVPAFLPATSRMILLLDGEIATLTADGVTIEKLSDGTIVHRDVMKISWTADQAQKGGFPHFMLKEIHEQPDAIRATLEIEQDLIEKVARAIYESRRVFMIAMGTSGHAAMAAKYMFSSIGGVLPYFELASEFPDAVCGSIGPEDCIVAVTQSGETTDTIMAARYGKQQGARVIAITNVIGSSIAQLADHVVITRAGPEIGVAATKTFSVQLAVLGKIAIEIGRMNGIRGADLTILKENALSAMPGVVYQTIYRNEETARRLAGLYYARPSLLFLGRGISVATACEGALKLKEIAYNHAEGYSAGQSKHGPIALVEPGYPVVFVAPPDETRNRIIGNMMEMKARGARLISVIERGDDDLRNLSDHVFEVPPISEPEFSPIAYVVPLQLFSYYVATRKGHDPDKPRNLAKSVTVL